MNARPTSAFRLSLAVLTILTAPCVSAAQQRTRPARPANTYSIVAQDPGTGQLGVAVQSHWFSVGSVVPWAESGVGAVATQSFIDPGYGANGLALMRSGKSAAEALAGLIAADPHPEVRQVGVVDASGRTAAHTGSLATVDRVDESLPLFAEAFRLRAEWRELVPRLARAELLPDDQEMIERILSAKDR